jgi:hypothetical protein
MHHVLGKFGVQIPHPMYKLEATAFHNFGITHNKICGKQKNLFLLNIL